MKWTPINQWVDWTEAAVVTHQGGQVIHFLCRKKRDGNNGNNSQGRARPFPPPRPQKNVTSIREGSNSNPPSGGPRRNAVVGSVLRAPRGQAQQGEDDNSGGPRANVCKPPCPHPSLSTWYLFAAQGRVTLESDAWKIERE
jgi:hypothetical protein